MSDLLNEIFKSAPEQKRVFEAVAEFQDACNEMLLAEGGAVSQDDVLEQMIYSAALSVYGSSWVTDWVRHAMAGAAMGVYRAYDRDLSRAAEEVRHEQHQRDGVKHDDDCEVSSFPATRCGAFPIRLSAAARALYAAGERAGMRFLLPYLAGAICLAFLLIRCS